MKIRLRVSVGDRSIEDLNEFVDQMSWEDSEKIEAKFGSPFPQWLIAIDAGSASANRLLSWLVQFPKLDKPLPVGHPRGELKKESLSLCPVCEKDQVLRTRPKEAPEKGRELYCSVCEHVYTDEDDEDQAPGNPTSEAEASATPEPSTKQPSLIGSESDLGNGRASRSLKAAV
jgi:hypothetical protein